MAEPINCNWVELSVGRAFRPAETALYYRKCKATAIEKSSFCWEHQQRFDYLKQTKK